MWGILSQTFREFINDECPRLAAALAYYTFFSLPALLVTIVFIAGLVVQNKKEVRTRLQSHFEETIGRDGARQLTTIVENASQPQGSGLGWVVGTAMLMLGATGALQELQTAVNRAWRVEPDPRQGGLRKFFVKRLLSLGLLLSIAMLLIASLTVSWGLAAFGEWIDAQSIAWLSSRVMRWLHMLLSLSIITLLFAALLRFLPDAQVAWRDVWAGAVVTAALFWFGQWVLGQYLAWSKPTSAYGAAGSLALVLLWIYYSALIFFLGAEFTHVLTERRGKYVPPERGAKPEGSEVSSTGFPAAAR